MKFFNLIYYFIWRFWLVWGHAIDKFTRFTLKPFKWLLFNTPAYKNRLIRLYGSIEEAEKLQKKTVDYVMNNQEWGFMMHFAWCFYGGFIALYIWTFYFILARYFPVLLVFFDNNKTLCGLVFVALAALVTFPVSYWNDRYKKYFKEFDKLKGMRRSAYKLFIIILLFGSFVFWLWSIEFAHHK